MEYTITDTQVLNQLQVLGLTIPKGLTFFPDNLEQAKNADAFVFGDSQQDVTKLFRNQQITIESLGGKPSAFRARKSADWYAPTLFISFSLLTQNADLISIALNVLSNYVTDLFKDSFSKKDIELDVLVETSENKVIKKLTYKGDAEGLKQLPDIIESMKS